MHSNRKQNSGARIEGAFSAAMHKAEQDKVKQFRKTEYYTLTQQKTHTFKIAACILIKELQKE